MALKQTAELKRQDFVYDGADDDSWKIIIMDSEDRQYIEISKITNDGTQESHVWDIEMLLDISDAIRKFRQKPAPYAMTGTRLSRPNIVDHRPKQENSTQAEIVQLSVDDSMTKIDDSIKPVVSMQNEIDHRKSGISSIPAPIKSKVKKTGVGANEVL